MAGHIHSEHVFFMVGRSSSVPFPLRFLYCQPTQHHGQGTGHRLSHIAAHLIKKAGFTTKTGHTGAVTLIQCFGSALNLNIHFHMLFLDGIYVDGAGSTTRFRCVKAPTNDELTQLTHTTVHHIARFLERQGLLEPDAENSHLALDTVDEDPMDQLLGHSDYLPHRRGARAGAQGIYLANPAGLRC